MVQDLMRDQTRYIIGKLRQCWGWSQGKRDARKRSLVRREKIEIRTRRGRVRWKWLEWHRCAKCKQVFIRRATHVDHIKPVVPVGTRGPVLKEPGYAKGFDRYIARLWCPAENLETLCIKCHRGKTSKEQKERKKA